jgi:amino acid adenylation domain-containing protein
MISSEARYPLTPTQQGMLVHRLSSPQSGVDIEQVVCTLREHLEPDLLAQAWDFVVARHDVLRTAFRWDGAVAGQEVSRASSPTIHWAEIGGQSPAARYATVEQFLAEDRRQGFDVSVAPIMRVTVFKWGPEDYTLIWTFWHALMDGRSYALILTELFTACEAFRAGVTPTWPAPRPFRDYVRWRHQVSHADSATFWRELLAGFSERTPLGIEKAPGTVESGDHQFVECGLSRILSEALRSAAKTWSVSMNTLVQAAWAFVLSRYSGSDDVVFGATWAGRHGTVSGAESMVGLFINTLPIRVRLQPDARLAEWLAAVRTQHVEMRAHLHTPLPQVQLWSELPPGQQLFDTLVVFDRSTLSTSLRAQGGAWATRDFQLLERTNYPITINAWDDPELTLRVTYDVGRLEPTYARRIVDHLAQVLERLAENPNGYVRDLQILTVGEREHVLVGWQGPARNYGRDATAPARIQEQAARTPRAVAAEFDGCTLSYAELNARANRLAGLLGSGGLERGQCVGVYMHRSLELVVALLAVWKAGGAYVPIDPDYPSDRTSMMLDDSGAPIVLTQPGLRHVLPPTSAQVIEVWPDGRGLDQYSADSPAATTRAGDLAYMIYTSGSTGRPKGALNGHAGLWNRLSWMQELFGLRDDDVVLQKTPYSFDVSVWEFFWPLCIGARLVLAKPGGHRDPGYLMDLIDSARVSVLHFVPSMLRVFVEQLPAGRCKTLRHIVCSGEALTPDLRDLALARSEAQLHNLYGPTEAAVDVTWWTCSRDDRRPVVPIGSPAPNVKVYVVDQWLGPTPPGIAGELLLGGVQVGFGYHNRPELTRQRFIPDPVGDAGGTVYRTGDVCRHLPDGAIEFLGRRDDQVKLRGFRIELAEIETALMESSGIRQAVVAVVPRQGAEPHLVAYVVSEHETQPAVSSIRAALLKRLPDYMVPSHVVFIDHIPLSPSGKIDRRALPAVSLAQPPMTDRPPQNPKQARIARLWCDALGLETVGLDQNFFDLGGDSLRLVKLHSLLRDSLGTALSVTDLFAYPTVRLLANRLDLDDAPPKQTAGFRDRAARQREALARKRSGQS